MSTTPQEPDLPGPDHAGAAGASGRTTSRRRPDPWQLVRLAALFYSLLVSAAWVWRVALAGEPLLYSNEAAARVGLRPLADAATGLAAAAVVIAVSWVFTRRTGWGRALARALAELVGRLSPFQVALLALASGVGEEVFFRGALQPRLGLVVASLIFGLVHFVPRREFLPWTAFSIAAGFLFGGLFEYTGNLLAPVVAHVVINGVNLNLLVRGYAPD